MQPIRGFKPYSAAVGLRYNRSFCIHNVGGVITDYVLGEAGAPGTPLPKDFYDQTAIGPDRTDLTGKKGTRRLTITGDNLLICERSIALDETPPNFTNVIARADHLFPDILAYLQEPKLTLLGLVWHGVMAPDDSTTRYAHPAAQYLFTHLSKVVLTKNEFLADVSVRFAFRRRMSEGLVHKDINDYYNIIIQFAESKTSALWPPEERPEFEGEAEEPAYVVLIADIQHVLDPARPFDRDLLRSHCRDAEKILRDRVSSLLGELGLG